MFYSFAGLVLSSAQRILTSESTLVPLPPKAISVLLVLVERQGQVVSRETLRDEVWGDTFVEDTAITRSISLLRSTLGPYLQKGEGIETLSKRGYRFTAAVTETSEAPTPPFPRPSGSIAIAQPEQASEAVVPPPVIAPVQLTVVKTKPGFRWILAALLVLGLLALFAYRLYRGEKVLARQDELAVVDFLDLSGTPDASWIGIALQESLSQGLSRDRGITAIGTDQVAVAEEDLGLSHARKFESAELNQLDKRLGVDYLLTGTYLPVGEQIRMDLVLHKGDKVLDEFSDTVERRDLQATVERASAQMRAALHLPQAQSGGDLQFFAQDQIATHFYAEGLRLSRTGDTPRLAREAFSKAVEADPQFAEAHEALAKAWARVGHEADSRAEAQRALATAASLPETRRLSLEASAYRQVGDYPKAMAALVRLRQLYPQDQTYKFRMASTYFSMHKYADATVLLREIEADATHPPNLPALELLASALAQQGDRSAKTIYAGKIMQLARAEGSKSAEAQAHLFAGMGWMGALDGAKAVAEFNQGQKLSEEIDDKVGVIAALTDETAARMEFHLPGAMEVGQRAMDLAAAIGQDGTIASECINMGSVALNTSQLRSALSYYKRALEMGQEAHSGDVELIAADSLTGVYLRSENLPEAQKMSALELQYAHEAGTESDLAIALQHQAEIESYLGHWAEAQAKFQLALTSSRRTANPPALNDLLVEQAWMLLQHGDFAQAAEVLRTVQPGLLESNEALAAYAKGRLQAEAGDPARAESLVLAALAKDLLPYMSAHGLDVLMEIAVRQKDAAKARTVAERYAALSRSIPEEPAVRRGAVSAQAMAEVMAGNRAGDAVRKLPETLREASRLGHTVEVAELQRVMAQSRQ